MKKSFRIKHSPEPINIREPASKLNVDNEFCDPSQLKNTAHVKFNYNTLDYVKLVKVNRIPAVG